MSVEFPIVPEDTFKGRVVKIDEGCVIMSAVDDPTNWDYAPPVCNPNQAVALGLDSPVTEMDTVLLLRCADSSRYLLIGNQVNTMVLQKIVLRNP